MRILFTGASSFTGYWFVRQLIESGHEVVLTLTKERAQYDNQLKGKRLEQLYPHCEVAENAPFGSEGFFKLLKSKSEWDALCHHAADTTGYKRPDFDYLKALQNNTCNLEAALDQLRERGCQQVLLTGSIFEAHEGQGTLPLRAFSAYGLSKTLTSQVVEHACFRKKLKLGKFTIPNPFGPLEEVRFTSYLFRTWSGHKVAAVNTPDYIRDNIHISLLAKAYLRFFNQLVATHKNFITLNPSCYVESQGQFAKRFSVEIKKRIPSLKCEVELRQQDQFPEPLARFNTDKLEDITSTWSEAKAWDELVGYYQSTIAG